MTGAELALIGRALRIAAEEIERNSRLGDSANRFAQTLHFIAGGAEDRLTWKGEGRYIEHFQVCAGPECNDFGIGAAGWLVWQSQVDPNHEMTLPLCGDCVSKARRDSAFIAKIARLRGLPLPLRFTDKLK